MHLQEAANIAQKHATKGYNKRMKGMYLNIGDWVLITNKSESSKKKLTDKWDPKVYMMED